MARTKHNSTLRRPLYATVGVTDRAVRLVRESVSDVQTRLAELQQSIDKLEREPQILRVRAVETVSSQAQQRRAAIEARVAQLQTRALEVPVRVQSFLEQHEVAYDQLVVRGDALIRRVRRQKSTQDTMTSARTTSSKAKTTSTQAGNAGRSTVSSTKRAAKSAPRTATTTAKQKSKAPRSSAKATATTAIETAKSAAQATSDAAKKVGD